MFPNYKPYLLFFKKPDGWKDLGKKKGRWEGDGYVTRHHIFCGSRSRLGKEKDELFHFCPKCMIKTHD